MSGAPPAEEEGPKHPLLEKLHKVEDGFNLLILTVMAALPVAEAIGRKLGGATLPGSAQFVSLFTLWIGFTGAMLATRQQRHLSLGKGADAFSGKVGIAIRIVTLIIAAVTTACLAWGAWTVVQAERQSTQVLPGGLPAWVGQLVMPIGYAVVSVRLILAGLKEWKWRAVAFAVAAGLLAFFYFGDPEIGESLVWPVIGIILIATGLGAPIYVALAGCGLFLFWAGGDEPASMAAEAVRQIKHPTMPAIPLFTFAGYILAESNASERLVKAVKSVLGWMPGGAAVVTALVCAFLTAFTGASGVTILALGGLMLPVLIRDKYPEAFSLGLLTGAGSIGLLFYPSLPVIVYGQKAGVAINELFVAAFVPGLLLVGTIGAYGIWVGVKSGAGRTPFDIKEVGRSFWEAKWELAVAPIAVVPYMAGWAQVVECAAITAAYALVVEVFIHKDLHWKNDMLRVGRECATLVGGVLIILGVAMGFSYYLVDAEAPEVVLAWVKGTIHSRWVFLIALNLLLLVVGCIMDIFSAIAVVVPLITPVAAHFGVHPLHLAVIFLANLELGYLTPPVGMNLFLASFRFKKPLTEIYKVALPFLLLLAIAVLLITYVPALTLAPVEAIFGGQPKPPPIKF